MVELQLIIHAGEEAVVTPRGVAIDMFTSALGGAVSGYLLIQCGTLVYFMDSTESFKNP